MNHALDPAPRPAANMFDVEQVRAEFPILAQEVNGAPLVYLDNGATSQKPRRVIDAIRRYYESDNANVHRGLHALSERATNAYEGARDTVRAFVNAADRREIVFVRGATEGLNLVAQSWARPRLAPGDEIVVTTMEHHSNIVPWQLVARQTGARLRVAPIHDSGELDMEAFAGLVNERTKVVAVAHVSNALGTVNPVREIIALAHDAGAVRCSTAPRPPPTAPSTSVRSAATSTCSPATSATDRPGWACSTAGRSGWRRRSRTRAAGT